MLFLTKATLRLLNLHHCSMKRLSLLLTTVLLSILSVSAQDHQFTKGDTLRGMLTPLRTCFDVTYYDLDVKVNPMDSTIGGSNTIVFKAVSDLDKLQIDLFENLEITAITHKGDSLIYTREYNAVFVNFDSTIAKGTMDTIKVYYNGRPTIAAHAPWDGGFVWTKDKNNFPWIGVACEGLGASVWWPNKDHLSDEPDSMMIRVTFPKGLLNVSNGRLRDVVKVDDEWTRTDWFVASPINNYNVTVNIGRYEHFGEIYTDNDGKELTLDYYVLNYNLDKAKEQFKQVKPMMACFEKFMGPYPFYKDGYKLVETPYLGMEHQSAIAYGNKYLTGYAGMDYSRIGLDFDYIIIHETGHEWWGNNVSMKDLADMWIHEGFCTYSEAIYVECMFGYDTAQLYVNAKKAMVSNDEAIIGVYDVNNEGSGDMYNKGMLMLNTIRHIADNDDKWWLTIKGLQTTFGKKTTTTEEVVNYMSEQLGRDLTPIFDQYLRYPNIPVYQYSLRKEKRKWVLRHRWVADVEGFNMPIKVVTSKDGSMSFVQPTTEWSEVPLVSLKKSQLFKVDEEHFYIEVESVK